MLISLASLRNKNLTLMEVPIHKKSFKVQPIFRVQTQITNIPAPVSFALVNPF